MVPCSAAGAGRRCYGGGAEVKCSCNRLLCLGDFAVKGKLFLSLLLAAAHPCAQSANSSPAVVLAQPGSQNCPVALHADRVPGGVLSRAAQGKQLDGKPLHVAFRPNEAQGIAEVDLVLHGASGNRLRPAGSASSATETETFLVSPRPARDGRFETVVYVRELTAVDYLELQSIRFADGTTWQASATSSCRVAPDGFMLVAGK